MHSFKLYGFTPGIKDRERRALLSLEYYKQTLKGRRSQLKGLDEKSTKKNPK